MKMSCWWDDEESKKSTVEWDEQLGSLQWIKNRLGQKLQVPANWLHPVEPEIAPGTLVYAWDGIERPVRPRVGWYVRMNDMEKHGVDLGSYSIGRFTGAPTLFDHVEPIAQQPEIDWSELPESVAQVLRVEGGWLIPVQFKAYPETSEWVDGMRIIEIVPRPKS